MGLAVHSPLLMSLACGGSSGGDSNSASTFDGKVIIIGAGAAGMAAGHLLVQQNIDFQILEASGSHGGRMKTDVDFAPFPIPLGAEWLHSSRDALVEMVDDDIVSVTTNLKGYGANDVVDFYDGNLLEREALGEFSDLKFIGSSWLGFFDTYIFPNIAEQLSLNTIVTSIDYSNDEILIEDSNSNTYRANKVIVTIPLMMLKNSSISFTPALPQSKLNAIEDANVWNGIKVFLEFNEKFYNTFLSFEDSETNAGQRIYYDASHGQSSDANIFGLFAVGDQALPYLNREGDGLKDHILSELDEVHDGEASEHYVKHIVQNWRDEPFIQSAYFADTSSSSIPLTLGEPVGDRLFFAGEAFSHEEDWGAVHNATRSAKNAVDRILSL